MPSLGDVLRDHEIELVEQPGCGSTVEPFVAMISVLLGRFVNGRKAQTILDELREIGDLDPVSLAEADPSSLAQELGLSRPPNWLPAILRLAKWYVSRSLPIEDTSTGQLREELVSLAGIGLFTADAILLEALDRPVYPVDRSTYRILARHGWIDPQAEYDEARSTVEGAVGEDPTRLRRASEWIMQVGKEFCRARVARCDRCPLRSSLPEGGPWISDESGD